jgi:hypothetical protein
MPIPQSVPAFVIAFNLTGVDPFRIMAPPTQAFVNGIFVLL